MAFNQPSQDSPGMMAHEPAAMDAMVYNVRTLKAQGKKKKKHGKNVQGYGPAQAGNEEELNASRQLQGINGQFRGKSPRSDDIGEKLRAGFFEGRAARGLPRNRNPVNSRTKSK
ncbi:unnamed protein product [Aphanomyces euteiches]